MMEKSFVSVRIAAKAALARVQPPGAPARVLPPGALGAAVIPAFLLAVLLLAACGGGGGGQGGQGSRAEPADTAPAMGRDSGDGMRGTAGMEGMPGNQPTREAEGMAGMTVRVTPEEASRIGLRWGAAERRPIVRTIRTSAVLDYPESEMVWVSPKVGGWVERLHVTFEGAVVGKGRPLLDLYSPDLVTAQEELLLARRLEEDLRAARVSAPGDSLLEVARRRLRFWDIPDQQIERLLATGEVTKTMTLHAPATGIVMKKEVFEGQGVKPGDNLFMIAPLDPVWVEAAVYEQDLPFVREGLPARVTVQGLPGRTFTGRVTYLYPDLRESSRTVRARIEIPNPRGELRPGMYATVGIESRTEPVLTIPSSAVLHTGTRDVAFMDVGGGRLMPMVIETGRVGEEHVEVLSGLEPGMRVATSAHFLIDSEANLMEAMQAMMAQMGRVEMEDMEMEGMEGMDVPPEPVRDTGAVGARDTGAAGDTTPIGARDTTPGGRR